MVFLAILAPQACAQRKVVSDYNYQKAVDAFFLKTKMMTRLSSLLINNLTRHQIIWTQGFFVRRFIGVQISTMLFCVIYRM